MSQSVRVSITEIKHQKQLVGGGVHNILQFTVYLWRRLGKKLKAEPGDRN